MINLQIILPPNCSDDLKSVIIQLNTCLQEIQQQLIQIQANQPITTQTSMRLKTGK